jgi:hypothetical protein
MIAERLPTCARVLDVLPEPQFTDLLVIRARFQRLAAALARHRLVEQVG